MSRSPSPPSRTTSFFRGAASLCGCWQLCEVPERGRCTGRRAVEGTRGREPHPAAAAIKRACSSVVSFGAAAAAPLANFKGASSHALELTRPARRGIATFLCQSSHSSTFAQILCTGQIRVRKRASARKRLVQLFSYLKDARHHLRFMHIRKGAPLCPRESMPARTH